MNIIVRETLARVVVLFCDYLWIVKFTFYHWNRISLARLLNENNLSFISAEKQSLGTADVKPDNAVVLLHGTNIDVEETNKFRRIVEIRTRCLMRIFTIGMLWSDGIYIFSYFLVDKFSWVLYVWPIGNTQRRSKSHSLSYVIEIEQ